MFFLDGLKLILFGPKEFYHTKSYKNYNNEKGRADPVIISYLAIWLTVLQILMYLIQDCTEYQKIAFIIIWLILFILFILLDNKQGD